MTGPMDISDDQSSLLLTFVHRSLVAGGGWSVITLLGAMPSLDRSPPEGMLGEKKPITCKQTEASDQKKAAPAGSGLYLPQGCCSNRGDEDAASGTPPLAPTGGAGGHVPDRHHEHPLPAAACRMWQGTPPHRRDPRRGSKARQEGQRPARHDRKLLGHSKYEPGI